MNNKSRKLGMFALMLATSSQEHRENEYIPPTKEEIEWRKAKAQEERNKSQGVQKFYYGDNVIYARNRENADRKARNAGFLK